jgi:hypothetical protein
MFCHRLAHLGPDDGVSDGVVHVKLVAGTRDTVDADIAAVVGTTAGLAEVPRPRRSTCSIPPPAAGSPRCGPSCRRAPAWWSSGTWSCSPTALQLLLRRIHGYGIVMD